MKHKVWHVMNFGVGMDGVYGGWECELKDFRAQVQLDSVRSTTITDQPGLVIREWSRAPNESIIQVYFIADSWE